MKDNDFIPYGKQWIDQHDIAAVTACLTSEFLTSGPEVALFEQEFAKATGAAHAVVCNSGTAALHLAALAAGLGKGDSAIVPAITFLATANAIRMTGAEVIFADTHPDTGLMTLETLDYAYYQAKRRGTTIKAVLPVFLAGQPTDPALSVWAREKGLAVISDACHALGGHYLDGVFIGQGAHEDFATFSLHPVKNIAMGEGGMVTTCSASKAALMRQLRSHGMTKSAEEFANADLACGPGGRQNPWYYEMPVMGYNYRAPDILCALGRSQLKKLPDFIQRRKCLAERYTAALTCKLPHIMPIPQVSYARSGWHLYPVLIDFEALGTNRSDVMHVLKQKGIGTQVHYIPVPMQPYYSLRYPGQTYPGAEKYYHRTLSLPLYPHLTEKDQDRVIEAVLAL